MIGLHEKVLVRASDARSFPHKQAKAGTKESDVLIAQHATPAFAAGDARGALLQSSIPRQISLVLKGASFWSESAWPRSRGSRRFAEPLSAWRQ